MATPFKMKGSPMQRNFGIGTAAHEVLHSKTKRKLEKKLIGPIKPMLDENKNKIPDTVESIDSKKGNIKKSITYGDTPPKAKKPKLTKSKPSTSPKEKKIIQMPNPNVRPPGYGLDR